MKLYETKTHSQTIKTHFGSKKKSMTVKYLKKKKVRQEISDSCWWERPLGRTREKKKTTKYIVFIRKCWRKEQNDECKNTTV